MEEYEIIRNSDKHYSSIQQLYLRASKYKQSLDFIIKKYNTVAFGSKDIGFIAYYQDYPAAYYGVFPIHLTFNNLEFQAAQSGDTMTDPQHQKKGLFILLANASYRLANENKIDFVFGFPNKNSLPGFEKKLNWKFQGIMKEFTLSSRQLPITAVLKRINLFGDLVQTLVHRRIKSYELQLTEGNLLCLNMQKDVLKVKKDVVFFTYKKYASSYLISYSGFTIFFKIDGHFILGDVGFFQEEKTSEFIQTLKQLAKMLLCNKIKIYLSESHWLYNYLIKVEKSKDNNPIGFLKLNYDPQFDKIAFTAADFDTF
jgi:hypothetical protein